MCCSLQYFVSGPEKKRSADKAFVLFVPSCKKSLKALKELLNVVEDLTAKEAGFSLSSLKYKNSVTGNNVTSGKQT